jgi:DNA-binding MarR family transcriptional regulator
MSQPVSDLPHHLGYLIRQVSNHVSRGFARKLAAKDMTVAEWALMRVLYDRPPMAPSQAALLMGMTKGAITKLVARLRKKSLVDRQANAADGRALLLSLTPQGVRLVPELAALADRNDHDCFMHLTADERRMLRQTLDGMIARFGITSVAVD